MNLSRLGHLSFCLLGFHSNERLVFGFISFNSDLALQSITYSVVFPKLDALDKENEMLKSDLVAAESKLESLEEFSEETANTLYINALEISNLKSNYELLTLQNTIFDSSIKAIESRLDVLEENSGIDSILAESIAIDIVYIVCTI